MTGRERDIAGETLLKFWIDRRVVELLTADGEHGVDHSIRSVPESLGEFVEAVADDEVVRPLLGRGVLEEVGHGVLHPADAGGALGQGRGGAPSRVVDREHEVRVGARPLAQVAEARQQRVRRRFGEDGWFVAERSESRGEVGCGVLHEVGVAAHRDEHAQVQARFDAGGGLVERLRLPLDAGEFAVDG